MTSIEKIEKLRDIFRPANRIEDIIYDGIKPWAIVYESEKGDSFRISLFVNQVIALTKASEEVNISSGWIPVYLVFLVSGDSWELNLSVICGKEVNLGEI